MDLRKRLGSVSARNWFILAWFFTSLYIDKISGKLSGWIEGVFLMPLGMCAIVRMLRSREYSGTLLLRVMLFSAAWNALSTLINIRMSGNWVCWFWGLLICWLYMLFVPKSTTREELKREVFSLGMLFICIQLVFSLLALYSVFTGRLIRLPRFWKPIGIQKAGAIGEPIVLLSHYNSDGRNAWSCILLAIYGILSHKNKGLRAFLVFAIVVNTMVLTHTQSRTSYIGLAAALGLVGFRAAFLLLPRKGLRVLAGVLAAAVAFGLVLGGLSLIYKADISVAKALKADRRGATEADGGQEAVNRVETEGQFALFSNGRGEVWGESLSYLKSHPRYLLTGTGGSNVDSFDLVRKERTSLAPITHYHNALLAALGTGGVPMVAAVLAFLCLMFGPCWRVFSRREAPESAGMFILPIFVFVQLLVCMPEEGIFLHTAYTNVMFYFLCGVVLHECCLSGQSDLPAAR